MMLAKTDTWLRINGPATFASDGADLKSWISLWIWRVIHALTVPLKTSNLRINGPVFTH
jgi:hypothetical protein